MQEEHLNIFIIGLVLALVTMLGLFKLRNATRRVSLKEKIRSYAGFILTEGVVTYLLIQLFAT